MRPPSLQPPPRRWRLAAGLLFAGATAGFTLAFGGKKGGGVGSGNDPSLPFRVVDGRVFVSRSDGAVLAVRRAPSDPRTFVLVGDGGSYALRLARGVEVSGVGDRELLTRVFSTRAWERALEPLELPGKGR